MLYIQNKKQRDVGKTNNIQVNERDDGPKFKLYSRWSIWVRLILLRADIWEETNIKILIEDWAY